MFLSASFDNKLSVWLMFKSPNICDTVTRSFEITFDILCIDWQHCYLKLILGLYKHMIDFQVE